MQQQHIALLVAVVVVVIIVVVVLKKTLVKSVEYLNVTAKEWYPLELKCATGTVKVESASYGGDGKFTSPADALARLSSACGGMSDCTFANTNVAWGGDPAPGVSKEGKACWTCQ